MKLVIEAIAILLVALFAEQFFPWWSIALSAFLVSFFLGKGTLKSFVAGFSGIGVLWFCWALYIDNSTNSILSSKIAVLMNIEAPLILVGITALIGGLVGGLASAAGVSTKLLRD